MEKSLRPGDTWRNRSTAHLYTSCRALAKMLRFNVIVTTPMASKEYQTSLPKCSFWRWNMFHEWFDSYRCFRHYDTKNTFTLCAKLDTEKYGFSEYWRYSKKRPPWWKIWSMWCFRRGWAAKRPSVQVVSNEHVLNTVRRFQAQREVVCDGPPYWMCRKCLGY